MKFALGDVVRIAPARLFGVVVRLPNEAYPRYRVRVSTAGWDQYVEVGALESELEGRPVTG